MSSPLSILVAGGATGIGAEAVRAFRRRGDAVLLADVNERTGEEVVAEEAEGPGAFLYCDFAEADAPERTVAAALEHGRGRLDVVFYNAGILQAHALGDWTVEEWDRAHAINLRAPFLLSQAAAPAVRASTCGRIILTSSTGAFRGHAGMPAYHATKAGLLGLVRALADELGPDGVTVNAVCPGWVDTPFNRPFWAQQADPEAALARLTESIPARRQAEPSDLTGLLLLLASEASSYLTGQALVVDGGYTAV